MTSRTSSWSRTTTPSASSPRWMWRAPPVASDPASATVADAVLPDGATVGVRAVRRDDEPDLEALIDGLSLRSRRLRFFSGGIDVDDAAQLAASAPGVGTILLGAAAELAAADGIETLTAVVLPDNHAMIEVFRESGFPVDVHAHPGELTVELGTAVGAAAVQRFGEGERVGAVAAMRHFLEPSSVAVIGASSRPGSVGAALVAKLRADFDGPVFTVGRGQSVLDVTAPVELAVVAVPAPAVEAVARECAAKGIAGLVVVSAGFEDAAGRRH